MTKQRERVAVTGASGLVGGILCRGLATDFEIRPVTRAQPVGEGAVAPLGDRAALIEAFDGCGAVVHLAGAARVTSDWGEVLEANIVGVRNVFDAALRVGVRRVVFASSNHVVGGYEVAGAPDVYELSESKIIDESDEVRPDSLYGVSKVFGEALARLYHDSYGLSVVCLRIGSVRADNDPYGDTVLESAEWLGLDDRQKLARSRATWLSHRDCVEVFRCALRAEIGWSVCFATSANPRLMWSLDRARRDLAFVPSDRAAARLPHLPLAIDTHRPESR